MGIPYYFKNLISTYGNIIKKTPNKCDILYLDFNCIIHQCATEIMKSASDITEKVLHKEVIKASIKHIDKITKVCKPSQTLYIAVDGVCPRAKMSQQRKRRYMSHWQKRYLNENSLWDSNIVTPGTKFMADLDVSLEKYVNSAAIKKKYRVICSPSREKGEGEHKILNHLREMETTKSTNVMIYGLDADLILLGLIVQSQKQLVNINLLRESPHFNTDIEGDFCSLDIAELMQGIDRTFCKEVDDFPVNEKICDFVMLTMFAGNDFLPPLSFIKIRNGGLDVLYKAYEHVYNGMRLISSSDYTINWILVEVLLKYLCKQEDNKFTETHHQYMNMRYFNRDNTSNTNEKQKELDNWVVNHKNDVIIDPTGLNWQNDYYKKLFHQSQYCEHDTIHDSCLLYIDGLEWNAEYYFIGKRANTSSWYYPYLYSPTIKDVCSKLHINMCKGTSSSTAFIEKDYTPMMQIMLVFPVQSIQTYFPNVKLLIDDPLMECIDMYPVEFKIMSYLKCKLWECSPILPYIDEDRLEKLLHHVS